MFDPKLYREACGELRAPQEKIEEIIAMTENNKSRKNRRPARAVLAAAAAVAAMAIGASAANPEVLEGITMHIASVLQVGELRQDMTTAEGETVTSLEIPEARVEDRDGRAVLLVMGEEIDITDALEREGQYTYTYTDEGTELTVLVEGSLEDWTMTTDVNVPGQEGGVSLVTTKEEQEKGPGGPGYAMSGDLDALESGQAAGEADAAASVAQFDGEHLRTNQPTD